MTNPKAKTKKSSKKNLPATKDPEVIPPELNELLKSVSPDKREEFIKQIVVTCTKWKAPLPRPVDLEHYEKVKKGLANRIVIMSEKEQDFRHKINQTSLLGEIKLRTLGIIFAFTIVILCLLSTIMLYWLSHDSKLSIALIIEIALIAGGFIYWSHNEKKASSKK